MALPLKSGADLYNQQLIRAAIWNHGADPSEVVAGLMYFNTSGSNVGKKLRFYTGTDWKTIAFAEDLDVATNKDFKALKEKVDLLSGEVDTDAIISNMKEVTAFLSGFAEDANLMEALNKKFDKSGGTIQGFNEAGTADTPLIVKSANRIYTAISLQTPEKETINLRWYDQYGVILANSSASTWLVLGEDKSLYYTTDGAVTKHTLLHSGNVGEYAVKTKGDSTIVDGSLSFQGGYIKFLLSDGSLLGGFNVSGNTGNPVFLTRDGNWKTIAFTDSTVEAAKKLVTSGGADAVVVSSSGNVLIGTATDNGTGYKLQVSGGIHTIGNLTLTGFAKANRFSTEGNYGLWKGSAYASGFAATDIVLFGTTITMQGPVTMAGTLSVAGKTTISNDLDVSNNIVANGTIACKGVAAAGSAPVGTVDKWAGSIASGTKSQTYTHGLGTTDITVAIYEKNGNEWVQILTDVDIVNANSIRVTFGANTTVEHRIVVMG